MISKETCRKLYNEFITVNGEKITSKENVIFDFFYTLMDEQVKKEVRRREEALLECHRLKAANEERSNIK